MITKTIYNELPDLIKDCLGNHRNKEYYLSNFLIEQEIWSFIREAGLNKRLTVITDYNLSSQAIVLPNVFRAYVQSRYNFIDYNMNEDDLEQLNVMLSMKLEPLEFISTTSKAKLVLMVNTNLGEEELNENVFFLEPYLWSVLTQQKVCFVDKLLDNIYGEA